MYFTKDALAKMRVDCAQVPEKSQALKEAFIVRQYLTPRAKEFAHHGLARRIETLARCIDIIFASLPPDREEIPDGDSLKDAMIVIQAFVFNAFGALDNLAWIWISEKGVTRRDGSQMPDSWVGFGKKNTRVRQSLSKEFQSYLTGLNSWFAHLEDFRHALAHRIPLYIVPYVVPEAKQKEYDEFSQLMAQTREPGEYERLKADQRKLVQFAPWMTHSYGEKAKRVVFHPQMLSDFNTIEEMARKLLVELDRIDAPPQNNGRGLLSRLAALLHCAWERGRNLIARTKRANALSTS